VASICFFIIQFLTIARWILRRIRNLWDKNCRENQNTHFMLNNFFFRKSCRLLDNVEKYGRAGQATDDYGACALRARYLDYKHIHWIRNTYCFSTVPWFHERTSMLRYTYIARLLNNHIILFMELLVARHCWSDSPLVRGSGASCNLVQEI